ncbi:hypothetical protein SH528x_002953 [Novipirellula sp. SH528]|uniref:hypothetical protein n=1 Tax=Novipirellula sp. SH528 TaxID=3454466 RepID=UPI003FA0A303
MTDSPNPPVPARDSEGQLLDVAPPLNAEGTSGQSGNAILVVGILVCLFGFYGITKYALGFLFPQSPAFFVLMLAFIAMYALVVTAGAGLVTIAQRVKEGHPSPYSKLLGMRVVLPLIGAFVLWVIAYMAIVPSLR